MVHTITVHFGSRKPYYCTSYSLVHLGYTRIEPAEEAARRRIARVCGGDIEAGAAASVTGARMADPVISITEADGLFWMVVRKDGNEERFPAGTKRVVAEVMIAQEERRLGLRPPHLTLDDLKARRAGQS